MNAYLILYTEERQCAVCGGDLSSILEDHSDYCLKCDSESDGVLTILNISKDSFIEIDAEYELIWYRNKKDISIQLVHLPWSMVNESNNIVELINKSKSYIERYSKLKSFW